MKSSRPKVEPIRNPTLFEMEKLEKAAELTSQPKIERPYSLPGVLLGTSAFTANGWQGSFYPAGMKPADYLKFYSTKFQRVEVDSAFYGTPSASTVEKWYERTPPDFIFWTASRRDSRASSSIPRKKASGCAEVSTLLGAAKWSNLP